VKWGLPFAFAVEGPRRVIENKTPSPIKGWEYVSKDYATGDEVRPF